MPGQARVDARGRHARRLLPTARPCTRRRRARRAGQPVAWHHRIAGQSILAGTPFEAMIKNGIDKTSVEGAADSPYVAASRIIAWTLHSTKTRRAGALVALGRQHPHRVRHGDASIDELAHAAGEGSARVPAARFSAKSPRHLAVLERAAAKAGWGNAARQGRARGIAVHESFGSIGRPGRRGLGRGRPHPRPSRDLRDRLRHRGQPARDRGAGAVRNRVRPRRPRSTAS